LLPLEGEEVLEVLEEVPDPPDAGEELPEPPVEVGVPAPVEETRPLEPPRQLESVPGWMVMISV